MCVCVGAGVFVGTRLFGRVFFRGGDRLIDVLHWSGIVYATRVCNCRYRRERERGGGGSATLRLISLMFACQCDRMCVCVRVRAHSLSEFISGWCAKRVIG